MCKIRMVAMPVMRNVQKVSRAGDVVRFPSAPKVPTLMIGGRKYRLSDYFPALDLAEESPGGPPEGGGKKFSYLWVYDTDRKLVTMWRHSDGDEKVYDRASGQTRTIVVLDRKGQLNRVTREEYDEVERFMNRRNKDVLEELRRRADELASAWERRAREILEDYFRKNIEPIIKRRLADLERGVIPLGFNVNPHILQHRSKEDQARKFVVLDSLKGFTEAKAYEIVSDAVGFDAYDPPYGDSQDVQWAWHAVMDKIYESYF